LNLPEPLLAFRRGGDAPLTCVFNLSPQPIILTVGGSASLTGLYAATLAGGVLTLPGNGFAFLNGADEVAVQ